MVETRRTPRSRPLLELAALSFGILSAALVGFAAPAVAWGPTGHRVVGKVAESQLSASARRAVDDLLAPDSLSEIATWADDIRPDPASAPFENWHWVNIDDGTELSLEPGNHQGELLRVLDAQRAILCDPTQSKEQRRDAVRWLTHLIGDMHQPLHIGKATDRGGNYVLVLWQDQPSNLHDVWDNRMIDATKLSYSEFVEFLDPPAASDIAAWKTGTFLDWAKESYVLRKAAYEIGDGRLSYKYSWTHLPTVRKRLQQAGVRLASILEQCLGLH